MINLEEKIGLVILNIQEHQDSIIKYEVNLRNAYDLRNEKRFRFYATKYTKPFNSNPIKQKKHYDLLVEAYQDAKYIRK